MRQRTRDRAGVTAMGCLVLVAALALSACGSTRTGSSGEDGDAAAASHGTSLLRASVPMAKPGPDVSTKALASGMAGLGYRMAGELSKDSNDGNLVYSPASLAIAFAMVREGAAGASAEQIDQAIGLPPNRQQAFNALLTDLKRAGPSNTLDIGNAIFTAKGYPIHKQFLDDLQRWYGAGVFQTRFPQPGKDAVNAYVAKQTHNLIPKLITDEFDSNTVMSLINTLYLNARWADPFDANLTAKANFTTRSGQVVMPKMMYLDSQRMAYADGGDWQAVRLPYKGDRLAMVVLVPRSEKAPAESLLQPQVLDQALQSFAPAHVELTMPRWSFGTSADLADLLGSLGMTAPFQPGGFPGITADPRFELDSVIQQARIDVAEKGTVAAAATQIEGIASSLPADLETVTADHPFAYAIISTASGVPIFEGTVGDPTAS